MLPFNGWKWDHAGHLMPVLARDAEHHAGSADTLKREQIQTSLHYPPVSNFTAFREFAGTSIPITQSFGARVLTLPLHPRLSETDVAAIVEVIKTV